MDNTNPTVEEVRLWGYDEELSFLDQDEDVILNSPRYVPVLMELANDDNCPKNDYCYVILSAYSSTHLSRRTEEVNEILDSLKNYSGIMNEKLTNWKARCLKIADLIVNPRKLSIQEAEEIAYHMTVGDFTLRTFKKLREFSSGTLEYVALTRDHYKEYFYINPTTSVWKVSRYSPLDPVDF